MRVKKAVLLVLNNKTKGSVLSTNGVHAVLNPVKRRGIILTEGDTVQNLNPVFTDIVTGTDVISTSVIYDRSFLTDKFDEIDIINVTFSKPFSENIASTDSVTLAQGLGILDDSLKPDQLQKNIAKVFGDVQAHVERITLSLNKNFSDGNLVNEIFAKLFSKVAQDTSIIGDVLGVTLSKPFFENTFTDDLHVKTFGKPLNELNEFIETTILNTAKGLSETNDVTDTQSKEVEKPFAEPVQIFDTPTLQPQKAFDDILNLSELSLRAVGKAINDVSDKIEQLVFDSSKILIDTPLNLDTPQKTLSKITSDFFSVIDSVVVSLLKESFLFDTVSYQEFNIKSFTKGLEDLGVTFEKIEFNFSSVREDTNLVLDQLSNFVTKVLGTDIVVSSDEAAITTGKIVEDETSITEALVRELAKLLQDDSQKIEQLVKSISTVLSEDPTISVDQIIKTAQKVISDDALLNDLSVLSVVKSIQDNVQAVDNIIVNIVLVLILADIVNNISVTSLDTTKVLQDQVQFAETIERLLVQNRFINENDTEDYTDSGTYFLEDYVRSGISVKHPDSLTINTTKGLSEVQSHVDLITIFSSIVKLLADSFNASDITTFELNKILSDLVSSTDELSRNVSTVQQDVFDQSDVLSLNATKSLSDTFSTDDSVIVNIALVEILSDSLSYLSSSVIALTKGLEETISFSEETTKSISTTLSESIQLLDLINIVLIEVGRFSDEYQSSSSGRLVSQNYVESAGYDSETYFLEDYFETIGLYFFEDYVGESRILT